MNNLAIELKNVHRSFDSQSVVALRDLSLDVVRGETVALTGDSGSGKSTLLNIMGALDFASSGEVKVGGELLSASGSWESFRNKTLGFVFQSFYLVPQLSLLENVELALMPRRLSKSERMQRALEMLKRVGLKSRADFFPPTVSGGERQRAAIARALVTNPDIILADEPTGNLDSKSAGEVLDLLEEMAGESNRTLVMVTHNERFAQRMKRTVRLMDGRIVE